MEPDPPQLSLGAVSLEVVDGVAALTLDRPDVANAIDLEMAQDLERAARSLSDDPRVRAVLLAGRGERFCAGGDLRAFAAEGDLPAALRQITTALHAAVSRLVRLDAPVVAAVQGSAAGAGLGLVAAADLVVAAASARFVMAYTAVGLTPDGSSTYFLPRLVGSRRALELALTNRTLTADEALEWGIVNEVVADADMTERATALVSSLASGPTRSFGAAKRLLRRSSHESLETQMEDESELLAEAAVRADAREGIAAFLDKRPPRFEG